MSWGVSLAAIFGHVFLMFVVTWLTCWILLSSVFMNASLIYSLAWSTIFIRALVVPPNFHCKLGLCFLSLPLHRHFDFFFGWLQSLSSSCFPSLEASLLTFRNGINYREAMNDQGKWKKFMATWQGTGSIPDLWSVASGYISKIFQTSGTQQHQKACQQRNTEMYDDVCNIMCMWIVTIISNDSA